MNDYYSQVVLLRHIQTQTQDNNLYSDAYTRAQIFVNASLLCKIPLAIIAPNHSGKTQMTDAISFYFKNAVTVNRIDTLSMADSLYKMLYNFETMIIADLQNVMHMPYDTRRNLLGILRPMISDTDYKNVTCIGKYTLQPRKSPLNLIMIGTPLHHSELLRMKEYDLLSRLIIYRYTHEIDYDKDFRLSIDVKTEPSIALTNAKDIPKFKGATNMLLAKRLYNA